MKKILFATILLMMISCGKKETSAVQNNNGAEATRANPPIEKTVASGNRSLPGYSLIQASDCMSCHKDGEKFVGPSYAEITAKYSEKDAALLADKIVNGGSGVWGNVPMAAHPNVSKEDAKKMVEYILSVKK